MKIFLTGISATPYAREYLSKFASSLREQHNVFVPHENSWQTTSKPWENNQFNFADSLSALGECDWLVAILDGYNVDDEVAIQVGMFYMLAKLNSKKRYMVGVLHDTRIAGWTWSAGGKALSPQVRETFNELGEVVPNFMKVKELLSSAKG